MRIPVFPCILGREIRDSENNKNGHAWLCATRCMQLVRGDGVGWGRVDIGGRLQYDIWHDILKKIVVGVVAMILRKTEIT